MAKVVFHLEENQIQQGSLFVDFWLESAKAFCADHVYIVNLTGRTYQPPRVRVPVTVITEQDGLPHGIPVYLVPENRQQQRTDVLSKYRPIDNAVYVFGPDSGSETRFVPKTNDYTLTIETPVNYPLWSFAAFILLMNHINGGCDDERMQVMRRQAGK